MTGRDCAFEECSCLNATLMTGSYGSIPRATFGDKTYRRAVEFWHGKRVFDGHDLDKGKVLIERHQQLFSVYRRISAMRAQA